MGADKLKAALGTTQLRLLAFVHANPGTTVYSYVKAASEDGGHNVYRGLRGLESGGLVEADETDTYRRRLTVTAAGKVKLDSEVSRIRSDLAFIESQLMKVEKKPAVAPTTGNRPKRAKS